MARGKGHEAIVAFKGGGSTWGTAVECGALSGFYAETFDIDGGIEPIPDMSITGGFAQKIGTPGAHRAAVNFSGNLSYQGHERVIQNFFGGVSGTPATVDTSAYKHIAKLASRESIFGTFCYEGVKDTKIVEAPSVQFSKLNLSGKARDVFKISMEGMGDVAVLDSSVNTTTTIDTVTVANYATVPFAHASFLMNDQADGDLASAGIFVSGIDLSLDRPIKDNVTTERGDKSSLFIPAGNVTGKLKIDFSIAQDGTGGNVALISKHLAATAQKAKITLTSGTLAGAATQYFQHIIWLPNLRSLPTKILPVTGPDGITWSQEFELASVSATPTAFTSGYTDGVVWEMFSKLSTNALA